MLAATVGIPPSIPDTADFLTIDKNGGIYVSSFVTHRLLEISGDVTTVIATGYPFAVDPLPKRTRIRNGL